MRILLVEDDLSLGTAVSEALTVAGHATDWVKTAKHALHAMDTEHFDLLVLDLGLPDRDGFDVIRDVRQKKMPIPILVLTARDSIDSRVKGLDLGADDYLVKPVATSELCARARALLRRGKNSSPALTLGKLTMDTVGKQAFVSGQPVELSAREWSVLEYLALHSEKIISKEKLIQAITSWDQELSANAIEAYVHRLRTKLQDCDIVIRTVRGLGYMLSEGKP
jgi:two-component system OmpR family response regulator